MLFNSYFFLLAFLPVVWAVYFGLNHIGKDRAAQACLIAASFFFYGYQDYRLCFLLGASILVNYGIHRILTRSLGGGKRIFFLLGLFFNFSLLFYFKYLDFAIENWNLLTKSSVALRYIALPLGISFYTFQQVSFVIDSYRGDVPRYRFLDYALFVAFFPQLVAGPIVLHSEIVPQFMDRERKRVNYENLTEGIEYLIFGLSKKVLLADMFARISDVGFAAIAGINDLNRVSAFGTMFAYWLQIYFDFSGYCDMAIGLGRLFNIEIPINFFSPYKAKNIGEFWDRWHITLTRFLTTYLYIPLGGSRKGVLRTYLNVMLVFVLSGLWHGASWTYVVWGLMHGVAMCVYRLIGRRTDRLPGWLNWTVTFLFVSFVWVFFRAGALNEPFRLYYRMVFGGGGGFTESMTDALADGSFVLTLLARFLTGDAMRACVQIVTGLLLASGVALCALAPSSHEVVAARHRQSRYFAALALLAVCAVTHLSQVSAFIYFIF